MEEIKSLRKRLKVSQYRLSQLSGVGRFRISILEMGYAVPTIEEKNNFKKTLLRISKAAGGTK